MSGFKFEFKNVEMTEEEFVEASKRKDLSISPGVHDLKILDSKFTKMSENDPTWAIFRLILSPDDGKVVVGEKDGKEVLSVKSKDGKDCKFIRAHVLVPTQKETYNSKNPTFMFSKLREFYAALGEVLLCSKESMKALIPKYFGKPESLKGQVVNCTIGFNGPHLSRDGDQIFIINQKGEKVCEEGFQDFDSAKAYAAIELDMKISRFVEILKWNPATGAATEAEQDVITPGEEW